MTRLCQSTAIGRITEWNARAELLFGWTHDEVMGKQLAEIIIAPEQREVQKQRVAQYLSSSSAPVLNKRIEISALNREGNEIPIELGVFPIKFGDNIQLRSIYSGHF